MYGYTVLYGIPWRGRYAFQGQTVSAPRLDGPNRPRACIKLAILCYRRSFIPPCVLLYYVVPVLPNRFPGCWVAQRLSAPL
jgi:hypothetical protein